MNFCTVFKYFEFHLYKKLNKCAWYNYNLMYFICVNLKNSVQTKFSVTVTLMCLKTETVYWCVDLLILCG